MVKSVVLGNGNDLFVGGQFSTRVWDGHHFVYVYHVALFDGMWWTFYFMILSNLSD